MARTIKFPLDMGNGKRVRSVEELRENFDAERVIEYLANGKLQIWLKDRHYQTEYEKVRTLNINDGKLLHELADIFQIHLEDCNISMAEMLKRLKLKEQLRQYTDDDEVLNNINRVAVSQEQFDEYLKKKYPVIYLFGESFNLPDNITDMCIKGINEPILKTLEGKAIDFEAANVKISQCKLYQEVFSEELTISKIKKEVINMTTTAMETREKFEYEKLYDGKYRVYNVGAIGGRVWTSKITLCSTKEAAKDCAFETLGYKSVPIGEELLTLEEMEDDTKARRFKYYRGHDMSKLIEFCTIDDDGDLDMDMTAYNKKYPNNDGDPDILDYCTKFILDYWGDEIRESMAARAKGPRVITSSAGSKPVACSGTANHTVKACYECPTDDE